MILIFEKVFSSAPFHFDNHFLKQHFGANRKIAKFMLQTTNSSIPELHTQKPIPENLSTFQQTPTTKSIIFLIGSHFTRLKLIFTKLCRTKKNKNFLKCMRKFSHLNINVLTYLLLTFTFDYKLKQRLATLPAIP